MLTRLRTFAERKLPIEGCSKHGLGCYGSGSVLSNLRDELHRPGVLEQLGASTGTLCEMPHWGVLLEILLGHDGFSQFHGPVVSDLELGGLLADWSRTLSEMASHAMGREFLRMSVREALFPRVPLAEVVTQRWLNAAAGVFDRQDLLGLCRAIPERHFAGAATYACLGKDLEMLAMLLERAPNDAHTREVVFECHREMILCDARLASVALREGWVPAQYRSQCIRQVIESSSVNPVDLIEILVAGEPECEAVAAAVKRSVASGASRAVAGRILAGAERLPGVADVLIDAAIAAVGSHALDAVALAKGSPARFRDEVGDSVCHAAIASGRGWDALRALQLLPVQPAMRRDLVLVALRIDDGTSSAEGLLGLLALPEIPLEHRGSIAAKCARRIGQEKATLESLARVTASCPVTFGIAAAAVAEVARTSSEFSYLVGALEFFPPADLPTREELTTRATQLVATSRDRGDLSRLLRVADASTAAYAAVVDEAVLWYPRHPAVRRRRLEECRARQKARSIERELLIAEVSASGHADRIRAILEYMWNAYYWPTAWASVDDAVVASLSLRERRMLVPRLLCGPREWRILARRLRAIGLS